MFAEVEMDNNVKPILLIEDRVVDLDLTKRSLAKRHLINPIQVARDGEEALDWLRRWEQGEPSPVFILLDISLPKVSGLEVLRAIKGHPSFYTIPIIMLTGSADDIHIQEAYKLGCNSYIVKPVDFDKFLDVASQIGIYWCALNASMR
jgi:CheY-like chemotaxis protein